MNSLSTKGPSNWKTFGFAAGIFWVFLFAEIFDEVRHDDENLFIWVPAFMWWITCAFSLVVVRQIWQSHPHMAPCRSRTDESNRPIFIGISCALFWIVAWGYSPLYVLCYDSIKWMLLILIGGWSLGLTFKRAGVHGVLASLLFCWFTGVIVLLSFLLFVVLIGIGQGDVWQSSWAFGGV